MVIRPSRAYDLSLVLLTIALMVAVTQAAPRNHPIKRRQQPNWEFRERPEREWVNPCNVAEQKSVTEIDASAAMSTTKAITTPSREQIRRQRQELLRTLSKSLKGKGNEVATKTAIDTQGIGEWFYKNGTYEFLARINGSEDKVSLRKWHNQTQVYIGALQNLMTKQRNLDRKKNEGTSKTLELGQMMLIAKTLLCEITTAMPNKRSLRDYTRERMDQRLNFSSATDVDALDLQFTKVRFIEFLRGMHEVLLRTIRQHNLRRKSLRKNGFKRSKKGSQSPSLEQNRQKHKAAKLKMTKQRKHRLSPVRH